LVQRKKSAAIWKPLDHGGGDRDLLSLISSLLELLPRLRDRVRLLLREYREYDEYDLERERERGVRDLVLDRLERTE